MLAISAHSLYTALASEAHYPRSHSEKLFMITLLPIVTDMEEKVSTTQGPHYSSFSLTRMTKVLVRRFHLSGLYRTDLGQKIIN